MRRRNLIPADAFPYDTPVDATYDSGDYLGALDLLTKALDYEALRGEQARRREAGDRRLLGIGVVCYVEITAPLVDPEFADVEVRADGTAVVRSGTCPSGQGHRTAWAMLAADELGIPMSPWSRSTGDRRRGLVRFVAVDDAGRILNPLLAEGQIHGGLAQGIAQALFEDFRYDEDGTPVTTTLADYLVPSAAELPSFETHFVESPSPLNELGVKGIGESGTIGSTPAVWNAVIDALAHRGVRHLDMPATPERIWRALQER